MTRARSLSSTARRPASVVARIKCLVIADIAVSRRHLQIQMTSSGYRMQDLGSPNGTMVNGKRVAEVQLMDGDQIELGNSLLRFEHPPSRPQPELQPMVPTGLSPPRCSSRRWAIRRPVIRASAGAWLSHAADGPAADDAWLSTWSTVRWCSRWRYGSAGAVAVRTGAALFMEPSAIAMSTAGPLAFFGQNERSSACASGILGGTLASRSDWSHRDVATQRQSPEVHRQGDRAFTSQETRTSLPATTTRRAKPSSGRSSWRRPGWEIGTTSRPATLKRRRAS